MQITRFVAPLKLLGLSFAYGLYHVVPMATLSSFRTDFLGTLWLLLLCVGKCLVHFNAFRSIGSHHLLAVKSILIGDPSHLQNHKLFPRGQR